MATKTLSITTVSIQYRDAGCRTFYVIPSVALLMVLVVLPKVIMVNVVALLSDHHGEGYF
jgi:hypothetical protein